MERKFKCCKCSATSITVRYLEGTNEGMWSKDERLACKCQTCGYTWTEKPEDKINKD